MAKGEHQKVKLLYLEKIFREETNEDHPLTMPEIISRLAEFGVTAERKTLYLDFEELRAFGVDIISERRGRETVYYLGSRLFELPELKLLVDSVQASRFITEKKSRSLIRKLESLTDRYGAKQLNRQVLIGGRVKTMNESIYYNVDKIHSAISENKQIRFQYFQWNMKKEQVLRHGGAWYQVSPWCLGWADENYYLIGYDAEGGIRKHYRVDKMKNLAVTGTPRGGLEEMKSFDPAAYTRSLFGMFGGENVSVLLEGESSIAGVVVDRFGTDAVMYPISESAFRVRVDVAVSPQFLGWVASLGGKLRVISPERVVQEMKNLADTLSQQYASGVRSG